VDLRSPPIHHSLGKTLCIITGAPAKIRRSCDNWVTQHDSATKDTGWDGRFADLPSAELTAGAAVRFTFLWAQHREGRDFKVEFEGVASASAPVYYPGLNRNAAIAQRRWPRSAQMVSRALTDRDQILDRVDAGSGPRGPHGFIPLRPRPDFAGQGD
jgi:hypothetical protein